VLTIARVYRTGERAVKTADIICRWSGFAAMMTNRQGQHLDERLVVR
jgi:hypothetical protein